VRFRHVYRSWRPHSLRALCNWLSDGGDRLGGGLYARIGGDGVVSGSSVLLTTVTATNNSGNTRRLAQSAVCCGNYAIVSSS
jgi:hypothetical protein